jgi:hypothetical protein
MQGGSSIADKLDLTADNVESVLDEVRPVHA